MKKKINNITFYNKVYTRKYNVFPLKENMKYYCPVILDFGSFSEELENRKKNIFLQLANCIKHQQILLIP